MKNAIILYRSITGFTRKYADWIAEELQCDVMPIAKVGRNILDNYGIIIYGAGMHASRISGLAAFRKLIRGTTGKSDKEIIVFATGGTPFKKELVDEVFTNNFTPEEQASIRFFYFQSGLNYEKMRVLDRIIMKIYSRVLLAKTKKNELEAGTSRAILASYDHSSRDFIRPMIDFIDHDTQTYRSGV
ncbi:MAG: flavodoxin domain-containing protein [Spirochaeta sp.]